VKELVSLRQYDYTQSVARCPAVSVSMITLSRLQDALLSVSVCRQYDYTQSVARCPAVSVSL
jgi:hypothetical protein